MSTRYNLTLAMAGALALAAVSVPAFAGAARDRAAVTTEFSAQNKDNPKNKTAPKNVAPKRAPVMRQAPVMRVAPQQQKMHVAPNQVQQQRVIQRHVVPQDSVKKKFGSQKYIGPKVGAPVTAKPRIISPKTGGKNIARKAFTPRSDKSRVVSAAKIRNMPTRGAGRTSIRGKNYSVWRSGYRARYHGGWRTFVGLGTLGVLAIGAAEYYPCLLYTSDAADE